MTLRHLRIFVAVCETGSMTAAASQLFIAQPSISLAVSEMEEYYGVKLFDRISRKLYLTENGRRALQYARHIIDLLDEMEQGLRILTQWDSCGWGPALPLARICSRIMYAS